MSVSLQDIQAAAKLIEGHVVKTPCLHSRTLSEITGAQVYLKFENHQFTASFKERGALNKLASLDAAQRKAGVIACSAGNHAQGVAYHAARLGIPAVIVMPRHTPYVKVEHTQKHGAEVILEGENFDAAKSFAIDQVGKRALTLVHPYDDPKIIAGQGTCGLEMMTDHPELDTLVVAIGGGGLISGISIAAKALKPSVDVVGVEMVRFPAMYHAMKGTEPQFAASTIAEGIAVKEPGKLAREVIAKNVSGILLVDEGDIEESIVMLLEIEKTVVEGAGAAPLAAMLRNRERFLGRKVGLVLGGGNIDPLMLAEIVERGMVRAGRLARVIVEVRDLPGSLARVTACVAAENANIEQVHHQRAFTSLAVQNAELEMVLKTRNHEHVHQIVEALKKIGFNARSGNVITALQHVIPAPQHVIPAPQHVIPAEAGIQPKEKT
jgi:threonine dehydratase